MVNVRPSTRSASSFTLRARRRRAPRVTEASVARIGARRDAGGKPAIATRASWRGGCVT
jgi:hypothetical protein